MVVLSLVLEHLFGPLDNVVVRANATETGLAKLGWIIDAHTLIAEKTAWAKQGLLFYRYRRKFPVLLSHHIRLLFGRGEILHLLAKQAHSWSNIAFCIGLLSTLKLSLCGGCLFSWEHTLISLLSVLVHYLELLLFCKYNFNWNESF